MKMHSAGKMFDKISLKAIRDTFFSNMWSVIRGGTGVTVFFFFLEGGGRRVGGGDIQKSGKVQTFELAVRRPQSPPLVGHPNLPIRKTLRRELGLLTVIVLKRV